MDGRWYTSAFRWPDFSFFLPSSIFRWLPGFNFSYFTRGWSLGRVSWSEVNLVDDLFWTIVTVLESVALVAMLCYFFVFCGCTL